jgi:hypothetical protein
MLVITFKFDIKLNQCHVHPNRINATLSLQNPSRTKSRQSATRNFRACRGRGGGQPALPTVVLLKPAVVAGGGQAVVGTGGSGRMGPGGGGRGQAAANAAGRRWARVAAAARADTRAERK